MEVTQLVNSVFTSNTYIVSEKSSDWVWLIDVGDIEGVLQTLSKNQEVMGVFITHYHYDHIYGLNKLIESFPSCVVYTSLEGKRGLFSEKLNLSFYHEDPIIFLGSNIRIVKEGDKVRLFDNCFVEVLETPGHNWSCLSYRISNYLFTGDSFIPGVPVVTKLKGGDRGANISSLKKIRQNIHENTIVCPGHGGMAKLGNEDGFMFIS